MQKNWRGLVFVVVMLFVPLWPASPGGAAEKMPSPADAALVNGKSITVIELEKQMQRVLRDLKSSGRVPEKDEVDNIRKELLNELIQMELMVQEGRRKGIRVEEAVVADRIKAIRTQFPDEGSYRSALNRDNLSESDLKAQIEKNMLVQELVNKEVIEKVTVTPDEGKAFYDSHPEAFKQPEQVHVSHILIQVAPKANDRDRKKARKQIEEIMKKVKKGGDFSALAKEFSQCPSRERGGDLGLVQRGQTVKAFEDVAFSMKPGETSGVVETEFGYHVVKVIEKQPEKKVSYEEAEESLNGHLKQVKLQTELARYLEGLKAKAKVQLPQ